MNTRYVAPFLLGAVVLAGCGTNNQANDSLAGNGEHDHAHPSEGPHGGELIELGNEAYHAEMLHDEAAGNVTIHVLDSSAVEPVAIEATEVTINVKRNDVGTQYMLAAAPEATDPARKSSRFVVADSSLLADMESGAPAQLVVRIAGAQYRGDIVHNHEHGHADEEDHEHDH